MEHLRTGPAGGLKMQIPCLTETAFDFKGEWLDYPKEQGFNLESMRYQSWSKYSPSRLAPFLQNWLFFGLLRAALPREVELRVADFIRTAEDGRRYITTSKLPDYLKDWTRVQGKLSLEKRLEVARGNEVIFSQVQQLTYNLTKISSTTNHGLFPPLPLECALSCALLGQALQVTNGSLIPAGNESFSGAWSTGDIILEQLELSGWCPFIVNGLAMSHELNTLHYLCTSGGPRKQRSHRRCSEYRCWATENVDAQHASPNCTCALVAPAIADVARAIRQGSTPALKYSSGGGSGTPALETAPPNASLPYIAISHVWSDGLGNPKGNKTHICQVERIQRAVDGLSKDVGAQKQGNAGWWWLDTLCVPKGKLYKNEEAKAIASMKEIYSDAESVLLIDSELCLCEDSMDALKVLCRLRFSNWIRRLWTFQEGLFAKAIYLLVGSTPRSLNGLVEEINGAPGDPIQKRIVWDLMAFFRPLFGRAINQEALSAPADDRSPHIGEESPNAKDNSPSAKDENLNTKDEIPHTKEDSPHTEVKSSPAEEDCPLTKDKRFITERAVSYIVRTVCSKTSTFQKDEAQCFALLLNLDTPQVQEILKAVASEARADDDRGPSKAGMVKLLELVNRAGRTFDMPGCFPPSIIFPVGKRLDKPGFRWAPESFLSTVARRENYSTWLPYELQIPGLGTVARPSGVLCKDGLRVMFPGLIISKITDSIPVETFFLIDTAASPPVRLSESECMPRVWRCLFVADEDGRKWAGDIAPTKDQANKLALIVGNFVDLGSAASFNCILVRIKDKGANGEYMVSRLGKIIGSATPAFDDHQWMREPWKRVEGTWLPLNQIWHVD